jgi:DNA polymerase sliding clamp subunit (PCNA homolog)
LSEFESQLGEVKAKLKYPSATTLATLVESLSELLEEASFTITKEGVKAVGMDPAKVAYIEVTIPYANFLEYEVPEEGVNLGANLSALSRALSRVKKTDVVTLEVSLSNLLVRVEGQPIREYLLPNLEVSSEVPEIKLEHTAHVKILSDPFKRALSDAGEFGDVVEVEATENMFAVRAASEKRVEAKFLSGSASLVAIEVNERTTSRYDFNYLDKVLAMAKVADVVDIQFSTDRPLELKFESPGGMSVKYILAPGGRRRSPRCRGEAEPPGRREESEGEEAEPRREGGSEEE